MEHEHLIEKTLVRLALPIFCYIFRYNAGFEFSQELLKSGQRFMENISD